jgi:hypothetical protein
LTEASVELQYSEIYYLTDASNKWLQRSTDKYRSGKSDMHEITKDFYEAWTSVDPLEQIAISDASISMSMFINANMEADKNNKYAVIGIVFGVRRQREGIHHCISRTSLARSKNRYVFIEQYCMYNSSALSTF